MMKTCMPEERNHQPIRNAITLIGAALVTLSALLFLFVFLADAFGMHTTPYAGIVFFLLLPAIFVLGLLLIPVGMLLERRRRLTGKPARPLPRIDLNDPVHRRTVFIVALLTIANLLIISLAAYRGLEFMDSPSFCGQVCHTVMEPEYTANQD